MTQEEVDLIYDYLHENYEYRDGELIRIKKGRGHMVGKKFGSVCMHGIGVADLRGSVSINGRAIKAKVSRFVYLFFYKKWVKYLNYKDGNQFNVSIDNLIECNKSEFIRRSTKSSRNSSGIMRVCKSRDGYVVLLNNYKKERSTAKTKTIKEAQDILEAFEEYAQKNINAGMDEIRIAIGIKERQWIKDNKYGFPGVACKREKYYGRFTVNGKRIYTEAYKTPQEAHEAYLKAKAELSHG